MSQPDYQFVQNLGDASPIEYGGVFLYVDKTGVYDPWVEHLESPQEEPENPNASEWIIHQYHLEPVTFIDGVVSDNRHHPETPAWWAKEYDPSRPQDGDGNINSLSSFLGVEKIDLIRSFMDHDVRTRSAAYQAIGDYWGFENLDQYPHRHTRAEVEKRYEKEIEVENSRRRRGEYKTFRKVWAPLEGGRIYGIASDPQQMGEFNELTVRVIANSVEDAAQMRGVIVPDEHVYVIRPGVQWDLIS